MADSYGYQERPRRRGRKFLIGLIVLLVVLGGALVVADRLAAGFAERAIADQVRQEVAKQDASASVQDVSVGGFPFLTQVLNGRYESISIDLANVSGAVNGTDYALPSVDIDARNVNAPLDTLRSGTGDVVAESVTGTGTLSYETVTKLINRPGLQLAEQDGQLAVTAPVNLLGQDFTVRGTADLSVDKGQVAVRFKDLSADELPAIPLAQAALNTYANQISINIPLPKLPFQLTVREVRAQADGLVVTADAANVPLRSTAG
ncbi:DUF2993 domain-containing protein [Plantactinospora sp. GCM10030261]|uniref:LmeA family phospholipid-binding protein n=1 Tax=Plantactinospora sp. GCM10030261 TaxID=3273420 RepID=UPI00360E21D1